MSYVATLDRVLNCDLLYSGLTRLPAEGEELFARGSICSWAAAYLPS